MTKYTLSSYDPIEITLPKPPVPENLVTREIAKRLEPFSEYHEVDKPRRVSRGDYLIVSTSNATLDDAVARPFIMSHSLYQLGCGDMPASFDEALIGLMPDEKVSISIELGAPSSGGGKGSVLSMDVVVEKILVRFTPKLTDEFVKREFAPCETVEEFRRAVAKDFNLADMKKSSPEFPDLILGELAKRLVEDVDASELMPGQPLSALRETCAIDALADHLDLELDVSQVVNQMPGENAAQREKIYEELCRQGKTEDAYVFARREAALSWLVAKSRISYDSGN